MQEDTATQPPDLQPSLDAHAIRKLHPRAYHERFLRAGLRPDGRKLERARKLIVSRDSISSADGSALVRLGNTSVVCGVKLEVAAPALHEPDRGFIGNRRWRVHALTSAAVTLPCVPLILPPLRVSAASTYCAFGASPSATRHVTVPNVDVSCLCSPANRPGPPTDDAQALTARLATLLHTSPIMAGDMRRRLCIRRGRHVWAVYVHAVCLNDDGNVWDAVVLAVVAALRGVRAPVVVSGDTAVGTGSIGDHANTIDENDDDDDGSMPLLADVPRSEWPLLVDANLGDDAMPVPQHVPLPISVTFAVVEAPLDDNADTDAANTSRMLLLVDPTSDEEQLQQSAITVTVDAASPQPFTLLGVYKPGGCGMSMQVMREQCLPQARLVAAQWAAKIASTSGAASASASGKGKKKA